MYISEFFSADIPVKERLLSWFTTSFGTSREDKNGNQAWYLLLSYNSGKLLVQFKPWQNFLDRSEEKVKEL